MGLNLGDYTVVRGEKLRTHGTIVVDPKYHVQFLDSILWSEAEPPILIGPEADVQIHYCRLEGTWVEWFSSHHGELTSQGHNLLTSEVSA